MGCAAGRESYSAPQTDVDRSGVVDQRARAEDDHALEGPVLERRAYVRAVLDRNPSVESARQGWRGAIARIRESGSFEDPAVDLGIAPLSIGSSSARLGYTAAISQRLPWPGKRALEESVAKAEAQAMKSDFETTKRDLALTAAVLYDQYFVGQRSLEIDAQHIALVQQMKAGALAQFASGRASAQDPLQAEAELTHIERDVVILTSEHEVIIAQMNELLHRDPDQPLPPPANDLALPAESGVRDARRLEDEAAARRPDIESVRLHAQAEEARAERADRESYPDVTVSTSYNSMWDIPEHRWMVGLGFNLPIELGRRAGAADEARAARARFESDAASLTDKARTAVAVAVKRLEEVHHVLEIFDKRLLPVARDQVDAARAGFTTSRNDFVAVIAAERNLRGVELDYQIARASCDQRRAELDRALGRMPGLGEEEVTR